MLLFSSCNENNNNVSELQSNESQTFANTESQPILETEELKFITSVRQYDSDNIYCSHDGGQTWENDKIPQFFMSTDIDYEIQTNDYTIIPITIINNSEIILVYGEHFVLQKYENNEWKGISLGYSFPGIGYTLYPNLTHTLNHWIPSNLTAGKYRICKDFDEEESERRWIFIVEFNLGTD